MKTELDAFELDRLDLFALQTLVKCMLHRHLKANDEPLKEVAELADLYEKSVHTFDLKGAESRVLVASKEYMLTVGHQMISEAARGASDQG